ncbi:hypothetical protein KIM67_12735 [Flagellimonas sp. 389]|uniref:Mu transposase domain-containing protein n=1 Tax=Flagellimonas sp. 389 TaxID=2835862 RepID=UPI001BD645D7|nr:hypothetical protein [Flagellimonas sp. 389]MBS9463276.1 hypothetical protein [Flagellimonas sp. 389]
MANKQIDMRKAKQIFKLYGEGTSKRRISSQLGISRNTVTKYIDFFKRYRLTPYEVSAMTLEEIHRLFKSDGKPKSEKLKTLEGYFPQFDRELRRSGVTKSSRYEPKVNETFADFAEHYETAVLPTRAYRPRDKAIVENAVRIIYTRVFAPLRNSTFHSKADINDAILELLRVHNGVSFRGREYSRRSMFEEVERRELAPLPVKRYEIRSYAKGTVHKNSHIYLGKDKHYYSVPYRHIGKQVRIVYTDSFVEVYHRNERLAAHERQRQRYGYTTVAEHMPSHHRFVSEWSSGKFIAWAVQIGPHCKTYIIGILDKKQHPEQSYKSCLGILHLAKKVGDRRLENACKRALDYGAYNYNMVERILRNGWDDIEEDPGEHIEVPDHDNIRGEDYYK